MVVGFFQLVGILTVIVVAIGIVSRLGNHENRIKTLETKREPDGAANEKFKH